MNFNAQNKLVLVLTIYSIPLFTRNCIVILSALSASLTPNLPFWILSSHSIILSIWKQSKHQIPSFCIIKMWNTILSVNCEELQPFFFSGSQKNLTIFAAFLVIFSRFFNPSFYKKKAETEVCSYEYWPEAFLKKKCLWRHGLPGQNKKGISRVSTF